MIWKWKCDDAHLYYQTLNVNINATAGEPISSTNGTANAGYRIHLIISKDEKIPHWFRIYTIRHRLLGDGDWRINFKRKRTLLHLGHRRLLWRRKQTKVDALKRKLRNGCIGIAAYRLFNDIGDDESCASCAIAARRARWEQNPENKINRRTNNPGIQLTLAICSNKYNL